MSKLIFICIIYLIGSDDFATREVATSHLKKIITVQNIPTLIDYGIHNSDPEIRFRTKEVLKTKYLEYRKVVYSIPIVGAIDIIDSKREINIEDAIKIKESPYIKVYLTFIIATRLWYSPSDYENIFSGNDERIINCINNNKRLYFDKLRKLNK